ncbi:50S ribosomal protein L25/general stress protein Ctc [Jatrophihabitans telluris]|uniref:Large ribosomal subunit protein bL25 n=1 Tax=Jatrophihabitans telluris TaxID=2038343 RepID=A0ABY4R234_9ACTN|nr:50S ribosomal protein L25/general stress protein Ctc [Jatrophihabitans telluris]UQX89346.1 50S ribosomal protein L25/general stress protein Ctc [Jatrophihabitans telluris]
MSEIRLVAEARTEFGKGGARRTRRAGKIPAVIYGHGADPRHISIPAREFSHAIKHGANVLLTLSVEGKDELAIPKAIQRDPIRGVYEHIDLLTVRRGEKVTIEVPLVLTGDIAPGGLLTQEHNTLSVEAEATNLPSEVEVSIEGLQIGAHITAADVNLPAGTVLVTDPEALVLHVGTAPTAEDLEAETAAAADELGIVEDQPETAAESDKASE